MLAGCVNDLSEVEQAPCEALTAAVTIIRIFPLYGAVAAGADGIVITGLEFQYFDHRQRNSVQNGRYMFLLTPRRILWFQRHVAIC